LISSLLKVIRFWKTTAFCAAKDEFGKTVTVVVTNNPELCDLQMRGIMNNIVKCAQEFLALSKKPRVHEDGKTRGGRRYDRICFISIKTFYKLSM
jgi:hypothetical protein